MGSLMSVGAIGGAAAYSAAGLPFPIAVLVGGLVAVLAGVIVGTLCNKLAGFILAVVTLGLGELARVVATNSSTLGGALGYKNVGFIPFSTYFPYLVVGFLLCVVFFVLFEKSAMRRAFTVIRENETLAVTLGINIPRHRFVSLMIGSFIAGIAGSFYIHSVGILDPKMFGFETSLLILMYPIFGGSKTFIGPIVGAVLLTTIPEALRVSPEFRLILYGMTIVLVMLFRPEGIVAGRKLIMKLSTFGMAA